MISNLFERGLKAAILVGSAAVYVAVIVLMELNRISQGWRP